MRRSPLYKFSSLALGAAFVAIATRDVSARPGVGSTSDPIVIDTFPYAIRATTVGGSRSFAQYSCGSQNESGPERLFRFKLTASARVTAWVEQIGTSDTDVHILSGANAAAPRAADCVARGDVIAESELSIGEHYISVDTYSGDAKAGEFILHVYAIGDSWSSWPIAEGVTWKARRFLPTSGSAQVVGDLVVDMTASGLRLEARKATGCQTIAQLGASIGAVAAINGGYFDTGNSCAPVSLLKHGGQLLGTNTAGSQRGAFALDSQRRPLVSRISTRTDWSSAVEAHGGGPVLVSAGVPLAGTSAWAQEGLYSSSFLGRNPRTTIGSDRAGRIHLTTIDGRRSNAVGMSMDELAAFSANELQQMDVVNMDGGGSTTLWIAGATPNGVVNYPSDSGAAESASHSGSRGVSGGWFVFANPLNHAPRFQTTPDVAAQYGETWRYDADAIDLNVDDAVTFRLDRAPLGALVDAASGEVTWTPDGSAGSFTLVAVDRRGTAATQTFVVTVAGVPGVADAGARDGGSSDGGSSDGGPVSDGSSLNGSDSTGCRIAAGAEVGASRGLVLLLVLYALALLKVQRKR